MVRLYSRFSCTSRSKCLNYSVIVDLSRPLTVMVMGLNSLNPLALLNWKLNRKQNMLFNCSLVSSLHVTSLITLSKVTLKTFIRQ